MTAPFSTRFAIFEANGGETEIPIAFFLHQAADLRVTRWRANVRTELTQPTHYTLAGAPSDDCIATLTSAAVAGDVYLVEGARSAARATDYAGNGPFHAGLVNAELDNVMRLLQELRRDANRSLQLDGTDDRTGPLRLKPGHVGLLEVKEDGTVIAHPIGTGGTGNVLGPGGTPDNRLALWDVNGFTLKSGPLIGDVALLASPAFTGAPTAPTPDAGDNSGKIANTSWVLGRISAAISAVLGGVSSAFDTLQEVATDLATRALKATTVTGNDGLTGGGDLSDNRTIGIAANGVTDAKLRAGAAVSVIGRSANSVGNVADIAAGANDRLLARTGDTLAFQQLTLGMIPDELVTYAKLQHISATARILGRKTAAAGDPEECTLSEILDFIGSAAQGDLLYRGASGWARLGAGSAGQFLQTQGAAQNPLWATVAQDSALPPGFYSSRISNNVSDANNDIDITAGRARDSTDVINIALNSGLTKRLDANWAVGTNQGGLDTGSKGNSTIYFVWKIHRTDTGVTDVLFSTSDTSPNMAAGDLPNYDRKQRIGWFRTNSSGNILAFHQSRWNLDEIRYAIAIQDVFDTAAGTSKTARTLSVPPHALALFCASVANSQVPTFSRFYPTFYADNTPNSGNANASSLSVMVGNVNASAEFAVPTDASRQIATDHSQSSSLLNIQTLGAIWKAGIVP